MRKILTLVAAVVLTAGFVYGKGEGKSLAKADENYLISLNHQNQGVVESAITNVMLLKLFYPEKDFSQISERLDSLSVNSPEKMIRLKAFIAANYLKHPERFNWIKKGDYENAVVFFEVYSKKLQEMNYQVSKGNEITATQ